MWLVGWWFSYVWLCFVWHLHEYKRQRPQYYLTLSLSHIKTASHSFTFLCPFFFNLTGLHTVPSPRLCIAFEGCEREREGRWTNRWCTFCMRAFVCVGGPMWWVWASHCHVSVVVCTWSAWMNASESKMGSLVVPFYVLYSNVLLLPYLSYQSLVLINLFFPWNNVSIHWSQLIMSCYMSF